MSLDVYLELDGVEVFSANVTHNLIEMAQAAGLYEALWRPEEIGATVAGDLVETVSAGFVRLALNPSEMKQYNPTNGWGSWDKFVPWVGLYLEACRKYPKARVTVSR